MEIRKATEKDIPAILEVLKASLGEVSSKKTEDVWRFKHINNPFGASLVLIAVEAEEIIGVRAFMRWKWQQGEKLNSCYRAVDTATHPAHQGKGVFKKLTLKAIEIAKEQGGDFIFNTPNEQSRPGYLKMGWEQVGKLEVKMVPVLPLFWTLKKHFEYNVKVKSSDSQMMNLCDSWNSKRKAQGLLFTPKTPQYLAWRYEKNALQEYEIFSEDGIFVAGYVKSRKMIKELRIVEVLVKDDQQYEKVSKVIKAWAKKFGATFVSLSEDRKFYKTFKISGEFGPVLTVRKLTIPDPEYKNLLNLKNFDYTLGDLELF